MKKVFKTLTMAMVCIAMAVCVSCKKDNPEPSGGGTGGGSTQTVATVTTNDVTEVTATTAVCGGEVTSENGLAVTQRGVCWGTEPNPTLSDSYTEDGDGIGKFTSTITGLTPDTKYYVRSYAKNAAGTGFSPEKSFTTLPGGGGGTHEYVDLGLQSGLLWATCNIGASNPQEYGDHFAWGETSSKINYYWSTYQWCNGSSSTLTKYCTKSSHGYNEFVDNKTVLELSDDAAHVNWGGDWRMPTYDEWVELENNCTWQWTTQGRENGYRVTGANGNSIFLPAAGCYSGSSLIGAYSVGIYWSSSLDAGYPDFAFDLYFNSLDVRMSNYHRYYGLSVRPVCASQK